MNELGKCATDFCHRHFGGLKKACTAAGLKYTTLHAQITHEREIPFSTVERLCAAAGVSLDMFRSEPAAIGLAAVDTSDELHRRAAQAYSQALRDVQADMRRYGTDIMVDDVLNWLHRHNGRLTDFDAIRERVDLFHRVSPDDRIMTPEQIGKGSLVARCFEIGDTSEYISKIGQLDASVIESSVAAHLKVGRTRRYQVEDIQLDGTIDKHNFNVQYRRVMAPVTALDGAEYTLVFAQLL